MEAEPGVGGEDPGEQSAVSPGQGPTPAACVRLAPSAGPGNHLPTSTALWVGGRVCVGGRGGQEGIRGMRHSMRFAK